VALNIDEAKGRSIRRHALTQLLVEDPAQPVLTPPLRHHLERVLRVRVGEEVIVNDGAGNWAQTIYEGPATLTLTSPVYYEEAPTRRTRIGFAPVKAQRPEWMVQKLTELGIDEIALLHTKRSVVLFDATRTKVLLSRLASVMVEAAQQCRRVHLPLIAAPQSPAQLIGASAARKVGICDPDGTAASSEFDTLLVGPEGGWDESEKSLAPLVSLSTNVLRAETALVAAGLKIFAHPPVTLG